MEIISELEVVEQCGSAVIKLRRTLIRVYGIVELISVYGKSNFISLSHKVQILLLTRRVKSQRSPNCKKKCKKDLPGEGSGSEV